MLEEQNALLHTKELKQHSLDQSLPTKPSLMRAVVVMQLALQQHKVSNHF